MGHHEMDGYNSPELARLQARVRELETELARKARLETALKESEDRFRLLYERAPLSYQSLDQDGNFLAVNQAWLDCLGYTAEEVLGRNFAEFLLPEWQEHFRENFPRFKAMGEVLGVEFEMRKKDGTPVLVSFTGRIGYDPDGSFRQTHCIFSDITKSRKGDLALQESQARYSALFEQSPVAIWEEDFSLVKEELDRQGASDPQALREYFRQHPEAVYQLASLVRITDVNQESLRVFGVRDKEELVRNLSFYFDASSLDIFREELLTLAGGGSRFEAEIPIRDLEGQQRVVLLQMVVCTGYEDTWRRALISFLDITGRKEAENALRESEARYRNLYHQTPVMLHSIDPQGLLVSVSDYWLSKLGYRREEVLGHSPAEFFTPESRRRAADIEMPRFFATGIAQDIPYQMVTKNGKVLDVLLSATMERNAQGRMVRSLAVIEDITSRREAEAERQRMEEQLRQAHKMQAMGTLAGGIAHDFNNIMGAIMGYAELALDLAEERENNSDELGQILKATTRARDLVRQIMTFSRKTPVDLQPVDLNQEVTQAVELLRRTIPRMVQIDLDLPAGLPLIQGNPNQLSQVLFCLVTNARDAMPDGGQIQVQTARLGGAPPPEMTEGQRAEGEYVRLMVKDTGLGMDAETLRQIYDPFFTTKEVGQGTGLGLSTVHGIVKSHGGFIHCQSQPGQGTVFHIHFPAFAEGALPAASDLQTGAAPGGRETLLLVDDEPAILITGARLLEGAGYRVLQATSGEEALAMYLRTGAGNIDLVITDLGMPGLSGLKLLAALRQLNPAAKLLVASGYAADDFVEKARAAGARAFVAKPFRKAEMLATIRQVLDQD
ncbi:MAG: PAS domain S-box protein [Deltaproteobacteria bacterium]|nr:PAS domain S-box protein [Deltaproteobacteria bacterium]